ncbi:F0F1 ATP synthase subunit A [Novosphingobium mangrovi (ex Huang et al. 2023)]|uniref:ATP synthase subunit a n=1 Tax=Novosphingobium mangrovi (ex Huang et al. 2023) TaxID=2976432 RepID=A0ABT2I0W4_9SPHN|nr:F0F1 ATP synthase subunit A [Novosphingobium mangrovi (ex Huang et al. 2023)]MCT2398447.1 F0F1 ATP synthase subunit A [Novosphingobium mangrovi (ex Huang et al. 2023)]
MIQPPLTAEPVFHLGPVPITQPVLTTWAIMALMVLFSVLLSRRLKQRPGRTQTVMELITGALDQQIGDVVQSDPAPYRALIGTIFLFVFVANWSGALPGVEPPTAHLETDAALALIVFGATLYHGVRVNGVVGYLKTFADPHWVMIPLNLVEQITRTFSLFIRLFGNVMSGVFIIAIMLSLAGFLVPIPLMALDLLTGAVQAYIFAILGCVFIGAAVSERGDAEKNSRERSAA